jgi:spore maturation protein SpmA
MLNAIWITLLLLAIICGALTGRMEAVTQQSVMAARDAVTLALGLIGIMAFWLGMMNIAREAGLLRWIAAKIRPLMTRLFPDVPGEHPAMSAMIMNMSANMLGLGNAATPFGLKAMMELDRLNQHKGTATNAMSLFLAINTSNVALLPTGVIAIRAAMGSNNPTGIIFTTLVATFCSTIVAIFAAKLFQRLPRYRLPQPLTESHPNCSIHPSGRMSIATTNSQTTASKQTETSAAATTDAVQKHQTTAPAQTPAADVPTQDQVTKADHPPTDTAETQALGPETSPPTPLWASILQIVFWATMLIAASMHIWNGYITETASCINSASLSISSGFDALSSPPPSLFALSKDILSFWLLPMLMAALLLYGIGKGVKTYAAMVEGAKEGFEVAIRIIPFLVAILVSIGMFRASGALDLLISAIGPLVQWLGMPPETLPMALMRPLSGSGAMGIMADTMRTYGPDSLIGYMVSTIQGSTETTFYVMAVYFGVVQIKRVRHTVAVCLIADLVGILAAVWICLAMFG